nr:adenylate/guanylate cyclase domain-containing protein [Treponema sp.]
YGIWLPLIAPLFCFSLSVFTFIIVKYAIEGYQKRFIKTAFRQYLSPAVIDNLIANPYKLKLGGEKRHISIFFSDIQNFTSLSEKLEAEKLAEILNEYLTNMTNIILSHGGTIDKYEGDAIIAFWNAPVEQYNHAARAVESAIECQKYLSSMEEHFTELAGRPLWTRIGLNTGDAVVGNFGSEKRFDYTMLGDSVNLASRLEGLNKQFGTYIMCSKSTMEEAKKYGCQLKWRELGKVVVVGKKDFVNVFEPVTESLYNEKRNVYDIFHSSLLLFYDGKIKEAMDGFYSISEMDDAAKSYLEKCKSLQGKLNDDWKGLWISNVK